MERKVEVRNMEKQSSERHLERVRNGRVDSLQTSSLHLDILRDLKRINAHIVSVAHPIMDEQGLLGESRLTSRLHRIELLGAVVRIGHDSQIVPSFVDRSSRMLT